MDTKNKNFGFVTLIAVIMISVILLAVAVSVSLYGASDLQMGFTENKSSQALDYAEACAEEAVYRLEQSWSDASSTLSFDGGYCIMYASISGSQATINSSGTAETATYNYTRAVRLLIDHDFNILTWEEPNI